MTDSPKATEALFAGPDQALFRPRQLVRWLIRFREKLDLPEPDRYWQTTAQVRWYGANPPSFLVRTWCLYAGHDMHAVKVRERNIPNERLVCSRCGWEGPWV